MLDFLAQATILDVAEKQPVARKGGPRKERNPEGLAIRVFRDGSVYPSLELVEKFGLEYTPKDITMVGNGFDVIDTQLFPQFQVGKRILIISPAQKSLPKVDLFGSTTYEEDGSPKASVIDQGSKTFGADDLIPMIEEIYGLTFAKNATAEKDGVPAVAAVEGLEFVDMVFVSNPATGEPWKAPKDVVYIPKKVSRGKDKGTVSAQRREKPELYAFLPAEVVAEASQPPAAEVPVTEINSPEEAKAFAKESVAE